MLANSLIKSPAEMLDSILKVSQNGVAVFQAVRTDVGTLIDLRVTFLNAIAERDMSRPAVEVIGKHFGKAFPVLVGTGLYERYCHVIETGETTRFEFSFVHPIRAEKVWFDISAARMGDSVVASFTDISTQKTAEQVIQQQADLLQGLMGDTPVGIAILEPVRQPDGTLINFRIDMVNPVLEAVICRTATEVKGHLITRLFPDVIASGFFGRAITGVELGITQSFEMPYSINDAPSWYRLSLAPQRDRLIVAAIDITETKQAQLTYHRQSELLRSVVDGSQNAIIAFDAIRDAAGAIVDFRYVMQNEVNRQRVGHSDKEVIGHTMLEHFPSVVEDGLFARYVQVVETGQSMRIDIAHDFGNGMGWYDISAVKRADGLVLTVQDITEQIQAEQARQEQSDLLKAIVDNSPTGIVLYKAVRDAQGQVIDFSHVLSNPANEAVTGLTEDQLLRMLVAKDYPVSVETGHYALLERVLKTGQPERRLFNYNAHGINGWFDGGYVRQGDGVLFTYLDVTDLKLVQKRLEQQNVDLHRSNDNLQQFAYVASHDLQEPLRKIQSFGDIIAKEYGSLLPANGQDMVQRMQSAATRMAMLIQDLLAYSRIGTHQEAFKPVALTNLLDQIRDDLSLAIEESKAVIEYSQLPVIQGDQLLLQQLFQNLLGNALKFRRAGIAPHIIIVSRRVSLHQLPEHVLPASMLRADTSTNASGEYNEISLTDNGIGFDEKYLDRIFQVFQRLHGKTNFSGSGVGLAICKKVADYHGGAIWATSQPGSGATFRVYLPTLQLNQVVDSDRF